MLAGDQKGLIDRLGTNYDPTTDTLIVMQKFVTANNGNLDRACEQLLKRKRWIKNVKMKELLTEFEYKESQRVLEILPRYYHRLDKVGHPVYYIEMENCDGIELFKTTNYEDFFKDHYRRTERQEYFYAKIAHQLYPASENKVLTVIDMKGVYLSQFNQFRPIVLKFFQVLMAYYPESMHKMVFVNVPLLFTVVWNVIKQFLDDRLLRKISIHGSEYQDELLDLIDYGNLPKRYGGGCNCNCGKGDVGPWDDYYDPLWDF